MLQRRRFPKNAIWAYLLLVGQLSAQSMTDADRSKLHTEIARIVAADGVPSASVAVVQDGRIVYEEAFGKASLQPPVAATPQTRYQLASVSKTLAAVAILQLEAAGKLSLDDTVSRWYPNVTSAKRITLSQILSHTSGLGNFYPQHYPAGPRGAAISPDSVIEEWGRHPLLFEPSAQFNYSNLGYEIAARIVEKESGEPYFRYLQTHVLQPGGMTSAIDLDLIPDGSKALATGYVREALGPMEPAEYEGPGWSFGSGQVVTTAGDVARWDIALMSGRVLPATQAGEQTTPVTLGNGKPAPTALGLFVDTEDGRKRWYHTGQGLGFIAMNMLYPDEQLAYIILVNTSVGATTLHVADAIDYRILRPSDKDRFARELFASLQQGSLKAGLLTADMQKEWSRRRGTIYRTTLGPLGEPTAFVAHKPTVLDGLETRDYDIVAGGHALKLHLLLMPDGRLEDVVVTDGAGS